MHDEHGLYGSAAAYPQAEGHPGWTDPYGAPVAGGYPQPPPMGARPLDVPWDPTAELEQLLQTSDDRDFGPPAPVYGLAPDPLEDTATVELLRTAAEPPRAYQAPASHRRRAPTRDRRVLLLRVASFSIAVLAAVIVSMVSVFGGMVALAPLQEIAEPRTSQTLIIWWPLLVYGPWVVASLSILRASLHRRRAMHSWTVVLFFSCVATLLCVVQAPRTLIDVAAAALPSLAVLACFQQLVRLITMVRPPRQAGRRHRARVSSQTPRQPSDEDVPQAAHLPYTAPVEGPPVAVEPDSPRGPFPRQHSARRGGFR
ncbi:DUF2637 domain-containing protein [Streptomyces jumonjinensis]|uniref:DUF2637 domain-containing protein n=1 Tax=Streptomyces jumonjinensis TaxID=1945 RepID=UPI00379BF0EA